MAKKKINEDNMTVEAPTASKNYSDLFRKIDSLAGLDKQRFCTSLSKDEKKAYISHLKERDCEMVTGVFRCHEPPGGSVCFNAMAHEGENPKKYEFVDGQEVTVPKYVAKRFESDFQGIGTWYPTNSHILDAFGKPTVNTGKKNRRFGFSSMDFQ